MSRSFILQYPTSKEVGYVRIAALMADDDILNSSIGSLVHLSSKIRGGAIPVGSVEFVRAAMGFGKIKNPRPIGYPKEVERFLLRSVEEASVGDLLDTGNCPTKFFVKPVETKTFTGFVFDSAKKPSDYSDFDRSQLQILINLPENTRIWRSSPVVWQSEYRYYVRGGRILGTARYDTHGHECAPVPSEDVVLDCIESMPLNSPYALDMGVLSDGRTALVEVNDAFAIGLYAEALTPSEYADFLEERWVEIIKEEALEKSLC